MNVRLGLKALEFIREIDFSLIGKKGRGGRGERNEKKEISNKNVPRPLIHEFSFCLLSLNNFPLTFLIEYCKWKKQINISPWPDVLSVMLFMIFFFCSVSEREGASSNASCQPGQILRCISVQSRQEKKLCFTFMLPRLGAYKMHPKVNQWLSKVSLLPSHPTLPFLSWSSAVLQSQ